MLVEAGIMIALAIILDRIKIYGAPQGGSVTAGSMIPIFLFAFRWGLGPGVIAGALFGILQLILGGWVFSPAQAVLEYPVAFGFLGLAGIFSGKVYKEDENGIIGIVAGVLLGVATRFVCHLLAGVIFFSEYAGSQNPWIYSLIYQASYLVPEFVISAVILSLIWKPLRRVPR